jgi:hypothetical protein
MPSTASRRFAPISIAIASMLSLTAFSADASAKSSHAKSPATTVSRAMQSSAVASYLSGTGMGASILPGSTGTDSTAGWGCAGSF